MLSNVHLVRRNPLDQYQENELETKKNIIVNKLAGRTVIYEGVATQTLSF